MFQCFPRNIINENYKLIQGFITYSDFQTCSIVLKTTNATSIESMEQKTNQCLLGDVVRMEDYHLPIILLAEEEKKNKQHHTESSLSSSWICIFFVVEARPVLI